MGKNYSNPCVRCGKQRIVSKRWKEEITNFWGVSEITYEETVCPDKECQKIVDKKLKAEREKREHFEQERKERAEVNKTRRSNISFSKKLNSLSKK